MGESVWNKPKYKWINFESIIWDFWRRWKISFLLQPDKIGFILIVLRVANHRTINFLNLTYYKGVLEFTACNEHYTSFYVLGLQYAAN
jgi:hypothetical protein